MPFVANDLKKAMAAYSQFQRNAISPHHARYSFPFFAGTYFSYRKVDVLRVVAIANAAADIVDGDDQGNYNNKNDNSDKDYAHPSYLDVGCGYGDFLKRVREFLPNAEGVEKDAGIFYSLQIEKKDHIKIADAHWIDKRYDVIFVGWMEPGQDFRDPVAKNTDVVVTTLDQGISLAAEFEGHGFDKIASWRTPSWEDVNIEIMNCHYTVQMQEEKRLQLARFRGAHNLWYVYAKPKIAATIRKALQTCVAAETLASARKDRYEFEDLLDECGFGYMQKLENQAAAEEGPLWHVTFSSG